VKFHRPKAHGLSGELASSFSFAEKSGLASIEAGRDEQTSADILTSGV
jgi:hypothetical protein